MDTNASQKESKTSSPLRSIFLLLLILIALYYVKPYLTGEQSIQSIDNILATKPSLDASDSAATEQTTLITPRVSDKKLRLLLAEFKERYEGMHSTEYLTSCQPQVVMIKHSVEGEQLLIEIESKDPESNQITSRDIVFSTDNFGRFVTTGTYSSIKLHPK